MNTIQGPKKSPSVVKKTSKKVLRLWKNYCNPEQKEQVKTGHKNSLTENEFWLGTVKNGDQTVELNLSESERIEVLNGEDLGDSFINAAMKILSTQFGYIGGWQDTLLDKKEFKMEQMTDQSIQIHHNIDDHWIVSTNIGGKIRLFDSLYPALTQHVQVKLAELYASFADEVGEISVHMPSSQIQSEGDSGLFAVAFAVELAFGQNPSLAYFNESKMHEHFFYCLKHGFKPFPKLPHTTTKRKEDGYFMISVTGEKQHMKRAFMKQSSVI